MILEDNFLDDFPTMRKYCDLMEYKSAVCPLDDVTYHGICTKIPPQVLEEIWFKIELVMGCEIEPKFTFMRLTKKGTYMPNHTHNDSDMAQWTFLLYLNRDEHCAGGTEIVTHRDGNPIPREKWVADHDKQEKWEIVETAQMRENRACIFKAEILHRAQPFDGFGTTTEDGRLVLTCFFDADPISH